MKLRYSVSESHYYLIAVDDVNEPTSWVPVAEGDVLPFAFWKVKSGREEEVAPDHPLVARYFELDHWLTPGTAEWRERAMRILKNTTLLLTERERAAAYYRDQAARLMTALAAPPENSGAGENGGLLV